MKIRNDTELMQWSNTDQVLSWFTSLERGKFQFLKFDVVEFYPSITKNLLDSAIKFAKGFIDISASDENIINNATKSILFHNNKAWSKKNSTSENEALFDIAMGSYHGAEVCELVGLYMLNDLSKIITNGQVGLYRDDGLALIPKQSGSITERLKKKLHAYAKSIGLRLEIEEPVTKTEFLDVVLNLDELTYSPYRKPNDTIKYINKKSNHPPSITQRMKPMVEQLISKRSSNLEEFEKAAPMYKEALKNNGYDNDMTFQQPQAKKKQRVRNRIWFNPPFCKSVKGSLKRTFIELVKKHFNKNNPLYKILNVHKIGFSYSCMQNMKSIIASHNKKILENKDDSKSDEPCNCPKSKDAGTVNCPMVNGSCQSKGIIYKATVKSTDNSKPKFYIGLTATKFKQRFYNHRSSFNNQNKKDATKLSGYIWQLKKKKCQL